MIFQGHYLAVFVGLLLHVGCSDKTPKTQSNEIAVRVINVGSQSETAQTQYVGLVNSSIQADLSFQVPGQVKSVYVTEGQTVKKGQQLAELECDNLISSNEAAQASLRQAQDGYNRLKSLYENGSLPEVKFVEIQTQLEQAKSMANIAAKNLKEAKLTAPFDGVITAKNIEPGESVLPATKQLTLSKLKPLEVKVSIPENEIASVNIGNKCAVSVAATGNGEMPGKVTEKNVIANRLSHTYEIKIKFDSEPQNVMPGMVCNVNLYGAEDKQALTLPAKVIQMDANGNHFVWCTENGTARRRQVIVGKLMPSGIEILSGIEAKDQVISDGSHKVCEGTKVKVL